jgi:hypothetical protein
MDYGKILSRAWEITWRWKVLWILGFLAALGSGSGGGGTGSYSGDGSEFSAPVPPALVGLILALLCLAVLIAIAVWVVSVIARGGLIAGVQQVEDEGSTTFGQAWRVGASRFWALFGIGILAAIPFIILLVAGIIVLVLIFAGSGLAFDSSGVVGGVGIATGVLCGGAFCCGMIILAIVLEQIRVYAERAAVLEGLGWIEAFKRGWDVLKANIFPTIIFWLIFLVIGFILAVIIGTVLIAAFIPFLAILFSAEPGAWLVLPLCCGGIIAIIVGALFGAIVQTFSSATWTLAYRDMTGMAQPAAELVAEPVEEQ